MWVVLIASIDFACIRAVNWSSGGLFTILGLVSLPMATLLLIGAPAAVEGFRGKREIRPFLVGFEVVGGIVLACCASLALLFPLGMDGYLEIVFQKTGFDQYLAPLGVLTFLLVIASLLLPQLLAALAGGWFLRRYKIHVTIERRKTTP